MRGAGLASAADESVLPWLVAAVAASAMLVTGALALARRRIPDLEGP